MSPKPVARLFDRTTPPHIVSLILIAGLAALSLNIFLPSLPSMAEYFGVEYHVMQLSLSLYLAMTAVLQLMIGPISDRYGRRPVMLTTAAIFTLATAGTIVAPNFTVFMTCRLIQAVIASGFTLSRAVIRDMVPQDQAASQIAYVTMGMSLVPMFAPVIGGTLDEYFGWQASFGLLGLCGLGLFALIWFDLGETTEGHAAGFAAQARGYPALLASQRFWGYCLAAAFASGAFFAYLGGAPFVGREFYHLDPAELGFYFGAPALGYMFGNFLSGRFSVRMGVNRMVLSGGTLLVLGMAALSLLTAAGVTGPQVFFGLAITMGIGNGIVLPNANAGMLSVRPGLAGSAAGLGGAIAIGGGAALSVLAARVLTPTSGPQPLILVMLGTSVAAIVCALWVIRRERVLQRS